MVVYAPPTVFDTLKEKKVAFLSHGSTWNVNRGIIYQDNDDKVLFYDVRCIDNGVDKATFSGKGVNKGTVRFTVDPEFFMTVVVSESSLCQAVFDDFFGTRFRQQTWIPSLFSQIRFEK